VNDAVARLASMAPTAAMLGHSTTAQLIERADGIDITVIKNQRGAAVPAQSGVARHRRYLQAPRSGKRRWPGLAATAGDRRRPLRRWRGSFVQS